MRLISTKDNPSFTKESFVVRKTLLQKLQLYRECKLIFIHAPAGYGKTVLLHQFADQMKMPVIWCRLNQNDNHPGFFYQHLLHAVPQFFHQVSILNRDFLHDKIESAELEDLLHCLAVEISERVSPNTSIILEDYHFLHNQMIHQLIESFVRDLPLDLQVIISSRFAPNIKLAKMKIEGIGAELSAPELAFSENECEALLAFSPKLSLVPELAAWLTKQTQGWVTGMILLLKQIEEGPPPKKADWQLLQQSCPELHNYFQTEVFADLSPDFQKSLTKMAVVDEFTPELADELLESDASRVFLDECSARHCFITQEIGVAHIFRYHPLFRDFLLSKLRESNIELFQKAGRFFLQRGYYQQAIDYSFKAEDYQMAAEALAHSGLAFLREGKLSLVEYWLNLLATKNLCNQPRLVFLKGALLVYLGRFAEAQSWFNLNQSTLNDIHDEEIALQIGIFQLKIYRYFGEYRRSLEIADSLNTKINDPFDITAADLNLERANNLCLSGNFHKALFILDLIESEATVKQINYFRSALYFLTGDFTKVRECYDKLTPNPLEANNWEVFSPGIFMAGVNCICGELSNAVHLIQLELNGRKRQRVKADLWFVYFLMALVQREMGELETACYYLEEAEKMFLTESREHHFLNLVRLVQCLLHVETGNIPANDRTVEMVLDCFRDKAETWQAIANYFAGLTALRLQEFHLAVERFDKVFRLAQKMGMKFLTAFSSGILAGIKGKNGERADGLKYAEQCLRISAKEQYRQLFWSEPIFAEVLQFGLEQGIELEFIKDVQNPNGVWSTKERLNQGIQNVGNVMPGEKSRFETEKVILKPVKSKQPAQLRIYCFGEFEVFCGKDTHTPVAWRTNKAKELLAFFIHHRNRAVTRQEVLAALWPEISPEQAATFLHTNLYFVRQILQKTGKNQRISYENGGYRLEIKDMFCDTLLFEEGTRLHDLNISEKSVKFLEQTAALYRGDYLEYSGWEWAMERREELNREYLQILQRIVAYYFQQKKYRATLGYLGKILQENPLLEEVHRMMMKAQAAVGDRQAVVRQYDSLRRILMDELGLEPTRETSKLFYEVLGEVN